MNEPAPLRSFFGAYRIGNRSMWRLGQGEVDVDTERGYSNSHSCSYRNRPPVCPIHEAGIGEFGDSTRAASHLRGEFPPDSGKPPKCSTRESQLREGLLHELAVGTLTGVYQPGGIVNRASKSAAPFTMSRIPRGGLEKKQRYQEGWSTPLHARGQAKGRAWHSDPRFYTSSLCRGVVV